jgi:hypothetical protein
MINTHDVITDLGMCREQLPFLTGEQQIEFNNIGYTGKTPEIQKLREENRTTTRTEYLNSLGIGEFVMNLVDTQDVTKHFLIIHVPNEEFLNREVEKISFEKAFPLYILGQTIKGTYNYKNYEGIECANGYKYVSLGGGCSGEDANTTMILDKDDNIICELDW